MSVDGGRDFGIISVISIAAILIVGFGVIGVIADVSGGFPEDKTREAVLLDGAGTWVSIDDATGTEETVWKTTGYAVNLSGTDDSFVESDTGVEVSTDQNWTASVWARADSGTATRNMTAVSLNGRLLIWWNGSAGNWSAWYFDEGARNSFQVNVSDDGDQPGNYTNIIASVNGTHLTIYRNNTRGDVENITDTGSVDAPIDSTNWDGRLEEIRTFDEALNSSQRQSLIDNPVDGQPDINRTARIMFDQPDRDNQLILFSSASLTQSNVTFSSGFDAQEMERDGLVVNGDYDWRTNGPQIRPLSGEDLEDAPVVYISYTFEEAQHDTVEVVGRGFLLGGVVVVVLFVAMVLRVLKSL